ncbi:MAG: hypothetical protein ACI4S9_06055, partial [Christensenellales bacterium]
DNKWNLDLDEALVWLRLNGMTGGPGGGSTVYSNTITGNYYTNIAQADNGNHVEGYRNVIEDNTYMFGTAESSWPEANESWEQEAKDIFYEAGLEESYRYLLEMYQ